MIFGIGVDSVEIERLRSFWGKPNLHRLFSEKEIARAGQKPDPAVALAGCFAAKEAVFKALGTGFSGVDWRDLEVCHLPNGRPRALLKGRAAAFARDRGIGKIHLSISHDRDKAIAMAIAEKAEALT